MAGQVIGTCALCNGPVVLPSMSVRPRAYCEHCGAVAANPFGPVIPMIRLSPDLERRLLESIQQFEASHAR